MLRKASPPPDPSTLEIRRVMVASEGRPITHDVIVRALELARPHKARMFVMSIARVWGTSLGFPNPGLLPTKQEWDEQRLLVREAVSAFEKAGFEASGLVLATRRATRRLLKEATLREIDAIVMGCDHDRGLLGDFVWAHEPYRVARRSPVPVYLVQLDAAGREPAPAR
jgi:nucleotide-binding universal stress UspA family protein